jgi:hypothetical protein
LPHGKLFPFSSPLSKLGKNCRQKKFLTFFQSPFNLSGMKSVYDNRINGAIEYRRRSGSQPQHHVS